MHMNMHTESHTLDGLIGLGFQERKGLLFFAPSLPLPIPSSFEQTLLLLLLLESTAFSGLRESLRWRIFTCELHGGFMVVVRYKGSFHHWGRGLCRKVFWTVLAHRLL